MSNPNTLNGSISNGIVLTSGGSYQSPFTIEIDGTINAPGGTGVYSYLTAATLINEGVITAGLDGVFLNYSLVNGGGAITNSGSASSIYGSVNGVVFVTSPGTLLNEGTIAANQNDGAYLVGGTISNAAGATISSQERDGIASQYNGFATTLTNAGVIISEKTHSSGAAGVYIFTNAFVTNSESGIISGIIGVDIAGQGTVLNSGTILGTSTYGGDSGNEQGVELEAGYISNSASGIINGGHYGINLYNGTIDNAGSINGQYGINLGNGSIYNIGTITGAALFLHGQVTVTNAYGGSIGGEIAGFGTLTVYNIGQVQNIDIHPGYYGYVSNASTGTINNAVVGEQSTTLTVVNDGLIQGGRGVYLQGGGTITNAGTIYEPGGGAVYLGGSGTNELIIEAGGVVDGNVVGGPSATNILSLAAGSGGTLDGVSGFQTIDIDAGTTWSLSGDQAGLANGGTINGFAAGDQITITDFAATYATYVDGTGLELVNASGTITLGITGVSSSDLLVASDGTASYIGDQTNTLSSSINSGITLVGVDANATDFTITPTGAVDTTDSIGVYSTVVSATLINEGAITAAGYGVLFNGGGYVSNGLSASIYGASNGVAIFSTTATIYNQGTISTGDYSSIGSLVGDAVYIQGNGHITNAAGATIVSEHGTGIEGNAAGAAGTAVTLVNDGVIIAQADDMGRFVGVSLQGDGYITNGYGATIAGAVGAQANGYGSVLNEGTIIGSVSSTAYLNFQNGLVLAGTGTISNSTSGFIEGAYDGILLDNVTVNNAGLIEGQQHDGIEATGNATITNSGIIESDFGFGINLQMASSVNNAGLIEGQQNDGIEATGNATITNSGTIESYLFGINLQMAGSVNNAGTIEGGNVGVVVRNGSGAATIVNAGTISGGNYAIYLGNMTGDTLIVDPGAVFSGKVGGHNAGNLLELTSSTSAGTIDSDSFSGFTTINVDAGADWTLTGTDGDLADNVSAAGTVFLAANSTLNVTGNIDAGQTIVFAGDHATLGINVNSTISGTIDLDTTSGEFQTIDIAGLAFSSMPSGSFDTSTDVLTIGYVGDPPETLNFNSPDAANYMLEDDGAGGTDVVIPCFVTDTRILTTRGYLPVQNLCVGDRVVTVREGGPASAEIIWLGERTVDCEALAAPETGWPVLVSRGALGHNMPARDLWVSRDHCLMVDNVLIPARELVNGTSIRQVPRARVTYWHVELPSHDIMLAEGMPAESYLDTGNRTAFAQPDVAAGTPRHWSDTCLPIVFGSAAQAHLARQMEAVG